MARVSVIPFIWLAFVASASRIKMRDVENDSAVLESKIEHEALARQVFQRMISRRSFAREGSTLSFMEFRTFFKSYGMTKGKYRVLNTDLHEKLRRGYSQADKDGDNEITEQEFVDWAVLCLGQPTECELFEETNLGDIFTDFKNMGDDSFDFVQDIAAPASKEKVDINKINEPEAILENTINELNMEMLGGVDLSGDASFISVWNAIKKKLKEDGNLVRKKEEALMAKVMEAWGIFEKRTATDQTGQEAMDDFKKAFAMCGAQNQVTNELAQLSFDISHSLKKSQGAAARTKVSGFQRRLEAAEADLKKGAVNNAEAALRSLHQEMEAFHLELLG